MTVDALPAILNIIAAIYLGFQAERAWSGANRTGGAASLLSWAAGIASGVALTVTAISVATGGLLS